MNFNMRMRVDVDVGMAISGRKRNGAPDAKYWDTNETVAKFDSVRQWLLKNCKKVFEKNYFILPYSN